jgi:signal transduction histidine kinase
MNAWWRAGPSKHGGGKWPLILGFLSIPLVGAVDYLTGYEISILAFYLPPIALVAWFGGSLAGLLAGVEAAVVWLCIDLNHHASSPNLTASYRNAILSLTVFVASGFLFAILRQNKESLEKAVAEQTSLLQKEINERSRIQREVADICAHQQRQIAYDLHDGLGQHLSGLAFKAKLLEQKLRAENPAQASEAAAITASINDALRQTRLLSRSLESTYGQARGLKEALHKLGEELEACHVCAVVKTTSSCESVNAVADTQLFRIAQEAVRNATEHGAARTIEISLESDENSIVLSVRDDGRGFEELPASEGMGLRTMRYRAQCIGASLVIESQPGSGTAVSCHVPKAADPLQSSLEFSS